MLLLSNKCQYFKQIMYASEKSSEIISFSRTLSTVIKSPSPNVISGSAYVSDGDFLCIDAGVLCPGF